MDFPPAQSTSAHHSLLFVWFSLLLATWLSRVTGPDGQDPRPQRTSLGARRLSWGDQELGTEAKNWGLGGGKHT